MPPHGGNEHTARHISSFKLLKHSLHPSSKSKDVEHHPCNVGENEVYEIPVAGCDMKERETEAMYITLHFGQHQIRGLVDTGARITVLSKAKHETPSAVEYMIPANGVQEALDGVYTLNCRLHGHVVSFMARVCESLSEELILGLDFLAQVNATIQVQRSQVETFAPVELHIAQKHTILPLRAAILPIKCPGIKEKTAMLIEIDL